MNEADMSIDEMKKKILELLNSCALSGFNPNAMEHLIKDVVQADEDLRSTVAFENYTWKFSKFSGKSYAINARFRMRDTREAFDVEFFV